MKALRKILLISLILSLLSGIFFGIESVCVENYTSPAYAQALDDFENQGSGKEGENTYYHFNPAKIFDSSGKSETDGGIMGGFVGIIDFIITKIFLPLGIVLSTWRIVYLAIFPLIIGSDPLDVMTSARYSDSRSKRDTASEVNGVWDTQAQTFGQAMRGTWIQESGSEAPGGKGKRPQISTSYEDMVGGGRYSTKALNNIKQELRFMLIGLLITFCAWGLVELMLKVAVFALNIADSTASTVVK